MAIARPLRKETAELLRYVLQDLALSPGVRLHEELGSWLAERRFESLLRANRDKVRKKLRSAADEGAVLDVRAELLVAYLLSADRRFEVQVEAYGSGNRGPDLAITFRGRHKLNVEVTRPRASPSESRPARLAGVMAAKLRQLAAGAPNVLAVVGSPDLDLASAGRALSVGADRGEAALLRRGGFDDARDLHARYLRLSAVSLVGATTGAGLWLNREARHPLEREVALALSRALGPAPDPSRHVETPC